MVGTPAQVFTRCHDKDITRIRSHVFGEKSKLTKGVLGYNTKSLCIYCSGDAIVDGQDTLVVNAKLFDQNRIAKFSKDVLKVKSFGFEQVDIDVPDELYDKFSEMAPLSLFKRPDCNIPQEMNMYIRKKLVEKQWKKQKVTGCFEIKKNLSVHAYNTQVSATWFETYSGLSIG